MSSDIAISVKDVTKNFRLPHEKTMSVKSGVVNLFRRKNKTVENQRVLKGVSFDVKKGDFFGVVGRNGSGKSTLLKVLAGIYQPTSGEVKVNGKLVPFIELGVGFNPELTGRENVYLNGALLGFSVKQIDDMYDEIVGFAELEEYMDQKLKNYSSGMQVRLAFSVAIKAQGDILVLDEVLAVGDEAFQRKCNEYFKTIKKDKTKTVILVTHSMESMRRFCNKAILIRDGTVVVSGAPEDVANEYTQENLDASDSKNKAEEGDYPMGLSERVPHLRVLPKSKRVLSNKDELVFDIEYEIADDTPVRLFFSIMDEKRGGSIFANGTEPITGKGKHTLTYKFPLKYYNDTDVLVVSALDEVGTNKRLAFTSDANSCRFAIRNEESDNGLLRRDNDIHGHWVGYEEFMYNLKKDKLI